MAHYHHNNNLTTSTFLSLPTKRALKITDLHHHHHHHNPHSPSKRPKNHQHPPPPPILAGHASLRILCPASTVSAFIGKSGTTIKQLQLDTSSKIRVDDSLLPGSHNRVILIVAPSSPSKSLPEFGNGELSAAQVAALRVFEKLIEVAKGGDAAATSTTCRVLIDASQAGYVIGKGGKMVEKLKKDSGAKIRVLLGDTLPHDINPQDEVVEIEGDVLSVKKGLLGVCGRLQQCPQGEKSSKKDSKPVESISQPTMSDYRVDPPLQRTQLYMATTSASPAMLVRPLSFEVQQSPLYLTTTSSIPATLTRPSSFEAGITASDEFKSQQEEVVFRVLCSNERIGGIIGRGGSIVQALQDESGAAIKIGPTVSNCDERVVTVTAKESAGSRYSPAQHAAILVFSRSADAAKDKGHETGSNKGSSISARLLVPSNQVGCLLGKGGAIVSEMRKATGANIRIIRGEQVPKCASEDDEVVEISGQFVKIQDALYQITSRLRSNIFPSEATGVLGSQTRSSVMSDTNLHGRDRDQIPTALYQSYATSQSIDKISTTRYSSESMLRSLDHSPSARYRTSEVAVEVNPRRYVNLGRSLASDDGRIEYGRSLASADDRIQYGRSLASADGRIEYGRSQASADDKIEYGRSLASANGGIELGRSLASANGGIELGRGLAPANGGTELGRRFASANGGIEFSSANRQAIVTNTTVEILVPESAIGSVYGEYGRNLTRIREISGARVAVHEAPPGSRDRTVIISGTPDETQAAQSLLHAFILTGSS